MASKAERIIAGLGGADNIVEIEPCITRLRTEVHNGGAVNEAALKAAGAHAVLRAGNIVHHGFGQQSDMALGAIIAGELAATRG